MIAAKLLLINLIVGWTLGAEEGDKSLNLLKQKFFERLIKKFDNAMDSMSDADRKAVVGGIKKMLNEKPGSNRRRKQYQHLNWKPNIGQWDFSRFKNFFG